MVDDECRAKSLQVLDGQFEILELEVAAVEVDCSMRFQAEQPERNSHFDDPLVVWIEGENEELIRPAVVRPAGAIRIGAKKPSALVELDEWLLTGELRLDLFELDGGAWPET